MGSDLSEIIEAEIQTAPEDPGTPEESQTEMEAATDGGEPPEPEIPAAFKEDATPEDEGEDGAPDLSIPEDLAKFMANHPQIKNAVDAFKGNAQRGIDKFINEHNQKLQEANDKLTEYQPLIDGWEKMRSGAESAWEEFANLEAVLTEHYGPRMGASASTGSDGSESKYGLEYASDDKVVDAVMSALDRKLDERLGPLLKDHEAKTLDSKASAEADKALPQLKASFEVSGDAWITKDMVVTAMREYPQIPPEAAFKAKYAIEIGKFYAKHASGKKEVRNLPTGTTGGRTYRELKPGADLAEILAAEATLG